MNYFSRGLQGLEHLFGMGGQTPAQSLPPQRMQGYPDVSPSLKGWVSPNGSPQGQMQGSQGYGQQFGPQLQGSSPSTAYQAVDPVDPDMHWGAQMQANYAMPQFDQQPGPFRPSMQVSHQPSPYTGGGSPQNPYGSLQQTGGVFMRNFQPQNQARTITGVQGGVSPDDRGSNIQGPQWPNQNYFQ
jgi:hypothetical protein